MPVANRHLALRFSPVFWEALEVAFHLTPEECKLLRLCLTAKTHKTMATLPIECLRSQREGQLLAPWERALGMP